MEQQQKTTGVKRFDEVEVTHNARLSAAEIAELWATFMQYTMLSCIFRYFVKTCEDAAIKAILSETMSRFQARTTFVAEAFNDENIPIPMGFTDDDVDLSVPRLFSEIFMLHYLKNMIRIAMIINSQNLNMASRPDVRDFYNEILESVIRLNIQTHDLMLAKGVLPRPPIVTVAQEVGHVHQTEFLAGFLTEPRPLLTAEIAHLYYTTLTNAVGRAFLAGLKQVTADHNVKSYCNQGTELADRIITSLTNVAQAEGVHFCLVRDENISESTQSPFSSKLMMFHINLMNTVGVGLLGVSAAASPRHDLVKIYGQYVLEAGVYSENGIKIMMANDWLEEPPQIINRQELAGYKH